MSSLEPAVSSTSSISEPTPSDAPVAAHPVPVEPLRYYRDAESDQLARRIIRIVSLFAVIVAIGAMGSYASQIWLMASYRVVPLTQVYMICMLAALAAQSIAGAACFKFRQWGRRLLLIAAGAQIVCAVGFFVAGLFLGTPYLRGRSPYLVVQLAGLVVQLSIPAFFVVLMRLRAFREAMR